VIDHERECHDALTKDPPKIDPRYYRLYADVVDRMGPERFERWVEDWEADHPVSIKGKRQ